MKIKILSYSLIFTALLALFLYVNNASIFEYQTQQIVAKSNKIKKFQDSILNLLEKNSKATYFSLAKNQRAAEFHVPNLTADIIDKVQLAVDELNNTNQWSKIIGKPSSSGNWISNTFLVLNHQWVIVEVTDGEQWMELILKYSLESEPPVTFKLISKAVY